MNILNEIIDIRTERTIRGENPTEIELTDDQHARLKAWCDSTATELRDPSGKVHCQLVRYEDGLIMGMRYSPKI